MSFESDKGRESFISSDQFDFKNEEIYPLIREFSEQGNYAIAADLAKRANSFYDASVLYEKMGNFSQAAEYAKQVGMKEKALELYEKGHSVYFPDAGEIAEEIGMPEKALEFYVKNVIGGARYGVNEKIEKLLRNHFDYKFPESLEGVVNEGIKLHVEEGSFSFAIDIAKKFGYSELDNLYELAAKNCEEQENFSKAVEYYKEINENEKVIELEEKQGYFFSAARVAEEIGDFDRAVEFCLKQKCPKDRLFSDAAEIERKRGNFAESIDFYIEAIENSEVPEFYSKKLAEVALEAGQKRTACNFFEKGKEFYKSAKLAKELNLHERLENLYKLALNKAESSGNFKEAEEISIDAGFEDKIEFYKNLNKPRKKF